MKRLLLGSGIGVACAAAFMCVGAARYQPTIRPNTFAGQIGVGGLTPEEAAKKLRVWWEFERLQQFQLTSKAVPGDLPSLTPDQLGVTLDDGATVATLPLESVLGTAESTVTGQTYPRASVADRVQAHGQNLL